MVSLLDAQRRLLESSLRAASLASWTWARLAEGLVLPSWKAVADIELDVARAWLAPAADEPALDDRLVAALRYRRLVATLGRALFGSARWPDEEVLAEDEHFRLTWIPPLAPAAPAALFHVGGVLPYGDPLFRLLPEANFFDRFRERGVGVYAMELKGDRHAHDYRAMTLAGVIGAVSRLSAVAEAHARAHGERRLVLEGYCALASHAVAYAAARAEEAAARFAALALFVGPIDGRRCATLAEPMRLVPEELLAASYEASAQAEGYVSGDQVRLTQDLALRALFLKTPLGYFQAGWKQPRLARALKVADLTAAERRTLAGAYWISPSNGRRWPVPLDLSRFSGALFTAGVADDGTFPFEVDGGPLALGAIRLPIVGFYGGKDVLVPEATAEPLRRALGERYTHVVHPAAGHITYVLSPKVWRPGPDALDPNPVDLILGRFS